jgi:hypothetical protein
MRELTKPLPSPQELHSSLLLRRRSLDASLVVIIRALFMLEPPMPLSSRLQSIERCILPSSGGVSTLRRPGSDGDERRAGSFNNATVFFDGIKRGAQSSDGGLKAENAWKGSSVSCLCSFRDSSKPKRSYLKLGGCAGDYPENLPRTTNDRNVK